MRWKEPLVPRQQAAVRLCSGYLLQRMPDGFPRLPSGGNGGALSSWHKRRYNQRKRNVPILERTRNERGRSGSLQIGRALNLNCQSWPQNMRIVAAGGRALFHGRSRQNVPSARAPLADRKREGCQVCCRDHSRIFRCPLDTACMAANKVTAVHRGRRSHFRRTTSSRRELPDRLSLFKALTRGQPRGSRP